MSVDQPERRFSNVNLSSTLVYEDGTSSKLHNPFDLVNTSQHSFKGWQCSAGNAGITISFDGLAYGANCRSYMLGRLDTFRLFDQPVTCPRQWCKTAIDIPLPKKKSTWNQDQ